MTRRTYTHQRTNTDRRSAQDTSSSGNDDRIFDMILDRLDNIDDTSKNDSKNINKGDQMTFTVPQILTGLVTVVTIGGSLLAAWVNLNNQITSQKVSTDIIIAQIQKDISTLDVGNKDIRTKLDNVVVQLQGSIDRLSNRIEDLDNTVGQLYQRNTPKK